MRIRTQLVLAFLGLAVLPLLGLVLYSYRTSIVAFRQAVTAEAEAQAGEMEARMARVTGELGRRVLGLGELPWEDLGGADPSGTSSELVELAMAALGDTAPFVDSLELVPVAPVAPEPAPGVAGAPVPPRPPRPPAPIVLPLGEAVAASVVEALSAVDLADLAELIPDPEERAAARREIAAARAEAAAALAAARLAAPAPAPGAPGASAEGTAAVPRPPLEVARQVRRGILSGDFDVPVERAGTTVALLRPRVAADEMVARVLAESAGAGDELAFAIAPDGSVQVADASRRDEVERILAEAPEEGDPGPGGAADRSGTDGSGGWATDEWLVVTSRDPATAYTFGIVRPMAEPLAEIRRTAVRNLGWGLGVIALGLLGILPLSRALSRQVTTISTAAGRVATGDLTTRVPVTSRGELGELARSFNQMARELSEHQGRLLAESERRREQEVRQGVLAAEVERRGRELEEARQLQLALLPRRLPEHPRYRLAVHMRTATEVGGDYYDFHLGDDGALTVAIGDATGHGARAGTMVTVVKALFTTYSGEVSPGEFLGAANRAVRRMDLGRMAMALALARFGEGELRVASAGMPPVLVHRRGSEEVVELALSGMPLGGFDGRYDERRTPLASGDRVLLMSDGLPELVGRSGEPMGYASARQRFAAAATAESPREVIASLVAAAEAWAGSDAPGDDVTLVLVEVV